MTDTSAVATRTNPGQLMALVEKFQHLDPNNFKAFLDIYRDEQDRHALAEFNAAYAAMLAEVGRVSKDKQNPLYRSRYASYEAMMDALEPIKNKYGIGIYFGCEPTGSAETMRPYLELFKGLHRRRVCEQDIRITIEGPKGGRPAMNEMQALGSSTTYIRKTFLQMAFNLVPSEDADDDGNSAGAQQQTKQADNRIYRQTDEARNAEQDVATRIEQFLGKFTHRCQTAKTQDDVDAILKDQEVMKGGDYLNKHDAKAWSRFCATRDEMVARFFGGTGKPLNSDPLVP